MLSYAVHADIAQQVCTDSLVHTSRVFEFGPLGVFRKWWHLQTLMHNVDVAN